MAGSVCVCVCLYILKLLSGDTGSVFFFNHLFFNFLKTLDMLEMILQES